MRGNAVYFKKFLIEGFKLFFFYLLLTFLGIIFFRNKYCFANILGLLLVSCGFWCNILAIYVNTGKMPIITDSLEWLGPLHKQLNSNDKLKFLCDIFSDGRGNVRSIGDYLINIGVFVVYVSLLSSYIFFVLTSACPFCVEMIYF